MEKRILDKLKTTELEILDDIVDFCHKNSINYYLIGGTLLGAVRHKGYIPWDDDLDIAIPREDYNKFITKYVGNEKLKLITNENDKNYWLPFAKVVNIKTRYIENIAKNYIGTEGIWVDIFPLDCGKKENSFFQRFQFKATQIIRTILTYKVGINLKTRNVIVKIIYIMLSKFPKKFYNKIQNRIMTYNNNNKCKFYLNMGSQYGPRKQTHLKEKFGVPVLVEFEGKKYNAPSDYKYVLTKIYGNNYMQLPPLEKRITHNPLKIKFEDGEEIRFEKI